MGADATVSGVGFGSQNKEAQGLMKIMQALEVKVGAIHDIEGTGFRDKHVQNIDVVEFAVGNVNENRDITAQIKEGMDFHGRFCFSEMGPGEQGKAEVYGRGIQCVDSVFNIKHAAIIMIEVSGITDESLREIRVDAPVAIFVCDSKSAA